MGCTSSKGTAEPSSVNKNKVCLFFGKPTAGKSWSADFVAKYHGWVHVDGDEEIMRSNPATYEIWTSAFKYFELQSGADPDSNTHLLQPLLDDLINKTKKLRAEKPDRPVAIALAVTRRAVRDYLRKNMGEPLSCV
jgi:hypothetical protein